MSGFTFSYVALGGSTAVGDGAAGDGGDPARLRRR